MKILFPKMAAGDITAWVEFDCRYRDWIYGLLYKFTRSKEIADELTQDFLLKLWEARVSLHEVKNPEAYSYIILKRMALTSIRNLMRKKRNGLEYARTVRKSVNGPEDYVNGRIVEQAVAHVLSKQSRLKKRVYDLCRNERMSYKEISVLLKIKESTAKQYYHDILRAIRDHVQKLKT